LAHIPKVMSRAHFAEVSSIWFQEYLDTSKHRFRGGRDVYSAFTLTHFVVERAREIMLWSWIVGTIGADDDTWGVKEGEKAWVILGGDENTKEIRVTLRPRSTLSPERLESSFQEAGEEPPKETEYLICQYCVSP
jgi:Stealth protein CR3, conserved region 3